MKSSIWRYTLGAGLLAISLQAAADQATKPPSFGISEHVTLGNEILLRFSANDPGQSNVSLHLPNQLEVTYGESLSMGDFFAIVGKPISKGMSESERKSRFIDAFNSFALNTSAVDEVNKLKNVIKQEITIVDERMKNGEAPEKIYKSISNEMGRQLNCATGGGCNANTWWLSPGGYLTVASNNYDHFGENAIIAYQTGHEAAIEQALVARQSGDRAQLELAYAMNAFACHYLSDRFSSGHIRTPRNELAANVTPDLVGSLLANYMHGEESEYGLHVHNQRNDHWIAYGDWSYFSKKNDTSRSVLRNTLQASADDIYNTYVYGMKNQTDVTADYIPIPDETNTQNNYDISPMFYWDTATQQLLRRTTLSNPYDRHWTADWWGWSTLAELREEKGLI